jgi:hypothetical protein
MTFRDAAKPVSSKQSAEQQPTKPGSRLAATQSRAASGGSDGWCSPAVVVERVRQVAPIGLDPCTSAGNPVGARNFFVGGKQNGLKESWHVQVEDGELVYINPPYSQAKAWAHRIAQTSGLELVTLVAARPDTGWWRQMVWATAAAVCFWEGRLRFVGAPSSAPFPSAVVYHGDRPWAFEGAFEGAGKVIRL